MSVLVSVIVPVYNTEEYIEDCLNSIIRQSYRNIEIICIDDGSVDDSVKRIDELALIDDRIKIIKHQVNMGSSVARNTGIKVARGAYVLFVDSDDIIDATMVEKLVNVAQANSLEMLYCEINKFGQDFTYLAKPEIVDYNFDKVYRGIDLFCEMVGRHAFRGEACGCLYSAKFLKDNKLYFAEGLIYEDNIFAMKSYMLAKRIMYINEKLYWYRQRAGSIMNNGVKEELALKSQLFYLTEIYYTWKQNGYSERENSAFEIYFSREYKDFIMRLKKADFIVQKDLRYLPEVTLLKLIMNPEELFLYVSLDESKIEYIRKHKLVYVYGAGRAAGEIVRILRRNSISINKIVLSNRGTVNEFMGINTIQASDLVPLEQDLVVVLGATQNHRISMRKCLESKKIFDIVEPIDL